MGSSGLGTTWVTDEIRVVHVDDDEEFLALTARMLERRTDDIVVESVTDADSALDRLDTVDCVVSDYQMPGRDGIELLSTVRERHPELPFILFTGKGSESVASEAIDAGVSAYLRKRTGSEQYELLANRIRTVVSQYRARSRLAQEKQFVDRVLETTPAGVAVFDRSLRITYANSRLREMVGQESKALLDRRLDDVAFAIVDWNGDPIPEDDLAVARARDTGETVQERKEAIELPDGTRRYVLASAAPIVEEGSVARVVCSLADVTERRRQDHEFRNRWEKIEALHEVAFALEDCETEDEIFQQGVEAADRVLELDHSAIYTAEDDEHVPRALTEEIEKWGAFDVFDIDEGLMGKTYRTGETYVLEDARGSTVAEPSAPDLRAAISVPIGDVGVFQAIASEPGVFDDNDRKLAELLVAHVREAIQRIRSEAEISRERDRFAALFERIPDPALIGRPAADDRPRIRAVNPAFEETFGLSLGAVAGDPPGEHLLPSGEDADLVYLDEVPTGEVVVREVRRETPDGPRDFLLRAFRVELEGEEEHYAIYTDITDRKDRERDLRRKNERLEEFANIVSHDLRNPLNLVLGTVETARKQSDDPALETIENAAGRMETLIEDLLVLAREGEVVGDTARVAVADVAREAWTVIDDDEATLRIDDDPSPPVVAADRGRCRQLFENLFRNGVEHGGRGVTVRVGPLVQDGDVAGFVVSDDGPGIPADDRGAVFESGVTSKDGGTGYGLSIVQRIVDGHGWTVSITDSEAGGARFEIRVDP